MESSTVVIIEELDESGRTWRTRASSMVRSNLEHSLAVIRATYNMDRTRVTVDGHVVTQAQHR